MATRTANLPAKTPAEIPAKTSGKRGPSLKARSLHLGLNAVGASACGGWRGEVAACENDADDMAALARGQGMTPTVLLTKKATRAALTALAALSTGVPSLLAQSPFKV